MAKKNADKSYGWYKAQDFGDYIERVVGEINIKLISIGQFHTKKTRFEVTISKTSFLGPNLLVRPHVVH